MAANTSDRISKTANGGIPVSATVISPRAIGITSLSIDSATNWPTDTGIKFSTYKVSTAGVKIAGSQTDWKGVLSGTTINNIVATGGAGDVGNAIGDYVQMGPTAQWGEDLAEAFLAQHTNPNGAHGAITTTSIANSGNYNQSAGTFAIPNGSLSVNSLSNPTKFSVYPSSGAVLPSNSLQKVPFNTEEYDTGNNFDNVTNYRFTAPVAGFYHFDVQVGIGTSGIGSGGAAYIQLNKNGTELRRSQQIAGSGDTRILPRPSISTTIQLAANDYIEIGAFQSDTSSRDIVNGANISFFSGYLVSQI